ncbi:methylmalonyl-CoA epimerase [Haloplanus sp. C73]|uniref:methylmalonyl-CoA epimerase n=1 Tax=Haloplanus sp. C73 TaxID=3421641 RepID=UPI003EC0A428
MRFDHVGIATRDAATLADLFGTLLDAPVAHRETVDGLDVTFLDVGEGYLELLEPLDDEGAIPRYLDREGPGIHHVALATPDVGAALETAREMGVELVDERPRPGAWGHDVAFLHPESTGGVLIEFVER